MEAEDLQTRFRVRVVGGFEAQALDAHFGEEDLHEADEAAEREAVVGDDAFDLVELGEVGGVDAFVAEDAVDGEVARGFGGRGELVEHVGRDGGGVGSEDEFEGFVFVVRVAVAYGAVLARLVDLFDVVEVFVVVLLGLFG